VNAGVTVPPVAWLRALRPGGRLIFPWQPANGVGLTALITQTPAGFEFRPISPSMFIGCAGATVVPPGAVVPDAAAAWRTRSVHETAKTAPDTSATGVFDALWFSDRPLAHAANASVAG
jgi:protein-L-isoaspartate(D-aspartate) O-methyltransferase